MPEKFQSYDEMSSGAGAPPGSIEDATRMAERRSRARARQAAETQYERGEVLATPGGTAAARERVEIYSAPARTARERFSDAVQYVRNFDLSRFTADSENFIRRHPASLAGAVVAGFALGRLLRRL